MSLGQRVEEDLKAALKSQNSLKVSSLRLMRNAFKNKEKDQRRALSAEEEILIIKTMIKQRREAAEQFIAGNRQDLAQREQDEIGILEEYMPAPLGEEQINAALEEVFQELQPAGPGDMGKIMKAVMARLGSAADGKLVSSLASARLKSINGQS